jgi:hypothetical protein
MSDRSTWKININGTPFAGYADIVTPLDTDGMPLIQRREIYGSNGIAYSQKGNKECSWSFYILIEQSGNAAAIAWWLQMAQTWNGVAAVLLTHKDYTGTETTWRIQQALVHVTSPPPTGVANECRLRISGSEALTFVGPSDDTGSTTADSGTITGDRS